MRHPVKPMSIVAAAALVLGLTGLVHAATEDGAPPPLLLLPSWGDVPGGRIVLPDGTAAVTFPDDWGAVALTDERRAEVLAADPNAEEGFGLSRLQVMAETKGDPQESCLLSAVTIPTGETAEDVVLSAAAGMGPDEFMDVTVAEVMLPAGLATRVGWRQVVENPERYDGPRDMYVTMLGIGHEENLYLLVCSGTEPPTGQWDSIAESMEWLDPSSTPLGPPVEDSGEVQPAEEPPVLPVSTQADDYTLYDVVDDADWCESILYYMQFRYSTEYCGDCDKAMNKSDARFQTEKMLPFCEEFMEWERFDAFTGEAAATVPLTYSMVVTFEGENWREYWPCLETQGTLTCDK